MPYTSGGEMASLCKRRAAVLTTKTGWDKECSNERISGIDVQIVECVARCRSQRNTAVVVRRVTPVQVLDFRI